MKANWCLWVVFLILPTSAGSETSFMCEGGYSGMQNSESCFRLISSVTYTYEKARTFCQDDGGDLASIHNAFEDSFVRSLGTAGMLIGLRYYESSDAYEWSDATTLDYKNYVDHFEVNKDYLGYCAQVFNGKWQNADCDTDALQFVCKRPATPYTPTPYNLCPNSSIFYTNGGALYSPGYPNNFAAGLRCYYKLTARNGYVIKIFLDNFSMLYNYDFFNVVSEHGTDRLNVALYPTEATGYEITFQSNEVQLNFIAQSGGTFKLTWIEVKESPMDRPLPTLSSVIASNANAYLLCSLGYTLSGEKCYRLVTEPKQNYYNALAVCRDDGGDLVSIHDPYTDGVLQTMIASASEAIIGLMYVGSGVYQWSDGSALDYTNYAEEFLSMPEYLGYCARLKDGKWHNTECTTKRSFICKKQAANYTVTQNSVCPDENTQYKDEGVLLSPGYPQTYASNVDNCYYELFAKKGYYIKIKVENVEFINNDYINILYPSNGQWLYAAVVTLYYDSDGTVVIVPHNHIKLWFRNFSKQSHKYRLSWKGIPKP